MSARDRIVIAIVVAVAAVLGAWLLMIQPKRDQASALGSQISAIQGRLASISAQVSQGEAARSAFARQYAELARLGEAVPQDDNVPSLIYQLQGAASATGVDFQSLVLNPAGSSSPAPSTGTSSTSQTATAALPPGAAVGPAGLPIEPFTFTFDGNFFHLANFFRRLADFVVATNKTVAVSGRLMTLNAISLGPGPQGFPQIQAQISATTYLVPASQGLENGATPAGPSTSAQASASSPKSSASAPPAVVTPPTP